MVFSYGSETVVLRCFPFGVGEASQRVDVFIFGTAARSL